MSEVLRRYGWTSARASCSASYLEGPVMQAIRRASPRKIVELGCGNGAFAETLAGMGYEVTAFDASDDGHEVASSRRTTARFFQASVYDEDLASRLGGDHDLAVSLEVIEHLYYPRRLFAAAHALLRSGGTLVLSTPYHGYLKNLALAVAGGWDKHFTVGWDGGHIKFFSNETLGRMAAEHGFTQIEFAGAGRLPYLWKSTVLTCRKDGSADAASHPRS